MIPHDQARFAKLIGDFVDGCGKSAKIEVVAARATMQ
jgi:hypothetical protein